MSSLPPPRYRIVERGRRLITVDSLTGEEIGLGATLANVDLAGAKQTAPPPRNKGSSSLGAAPVAALLEESLPSPTALNPLQGSSKRQAKAVSPDKQAKIFGLLVFAILVIIFLIVTGLWVVPVALMVVPMTRKAILPLLGDGFRKFMGQD